MYQHIQQTEAMRNFAADLRRRDAEAEILPDEMAERSFRTSNPLLRTGADRERWAGHFALALSLGHDPRDIFTFSLAQLMRL